MAGTITTIEIPTGNAWVAELVDEGERPISKSRLVDGRGRSGAFLRPERPFTFANRGSMLPAGYVCAPPAGNIYIFNNVLKDMLRAGWPGDVAAGERLMSEMMIGRR